MRKRHGLSPKNGYFMLVNTWYRAATISAIVANYTDKQG
ncbi:hypothetical protein PULV_b0291 [Pseudoalteromonas ulvae UL12]|nr:hypothetical protein [Pseudoalteromonas ulvae UL12]